MEELDHLYQLAKQQGLHSIVQFMDDMKQAKLEMQYYAGRFFWKGPAVVVPNIQDVLHNTKVPCQWDNMGLDFVVYPKQSF
jgi:hypothetical protein